MDLVAVHTHVHADVISVAVHTHVHADVISHARCSRRSRCWKTHTHTYTHIHTHAGARAALDAGRPLRTLRDGSRSHITQRPPYGSATLLPAAAARNIHTHGPRRSGSGLAPMPSVAGARGRLEACGARATRTLRAYACVCMDAACLCMRVCMAYACVCVWRRRADAQMTSILGCLSILRAASSPQWAPLSLRGGRNESTAPYTLVGERRAPSSLVGPSGGSGLASTPSCATTCKCTQRTQAPRHAVLF